MISGQYVDTFTEASHGMLDGANLNARYSFYWGPIKAVEADHIVFVGAGEEMRLPIIRSGRGEHSIVSVKDPVFGSLKFRLVPFNGEEQ